MLILMNEHKTIEHQLLLPYILQIQLHGTTMHYFVRMGLKLLTNVDGKIAVNIQIIQQDFVPEKPIDQPAIYFTTSTGII